MDDIQIEIYQKMPIYKRIRIGCQLHDFAYQRLKTYLLKQNKGLDEESIKREILKRFIGDTTGIFSKNIKGT